MFSSKFSNVLRRGFLTAFLLVGGGIVAALAQDGAGLRVIGNVTDEKGEPLVAATVYAKNNKSVNAITDIDGNYSIVVPDKWTVLVFDFVGYVTKEETVGERKVVNVELVEDSWMTQWSSLMVLRKRSPSSRQSPLLSRLPSRSPLRVH